MDVSKFLEKIDTMAKEEKDAKRRKQLLLIAAVVATVVTAGTIAYVAAPALLGAGASAATAGAGLTSSATIAAVHSAGMSQATGSALLMNNAVRLISFGLSSTMQHYKDMLASSHVAALERVAARINNSTTETEVLRWIAEAGGLNQARKK